MSLEQTQHPVEEAEPGRAQPAYRWYHKALALAFVIFCLEIGVILLVVPWSGYWFENYLSTLDPVWREVWTSAYFRGAVSGLGIVNIYISFGELIRLRRFAG
jgi:hypothetical protein